MKLVRQKFSVSKSKNYTHYTYHSYHDVKLSLPGERKWVRINITSVRNIFTFIRRRQSQLDYNKIY